MPQTGSRHKGKKMHWVRWASLVLTDRELCRVPNYILFCLGTCKDASVPDIRGSGCSSFAGQAGDQSAGAMQYGLVQGKALVAEPGKVEPRKGCHGALRITCRSSGGGGGRDSRLIIPGQSGEQGRQSGRLIIPGAQCAPLLLLSWRTPVRTSARYRFALKVSLVLPLRRTAGLLFYAKSTCCWSVRRWL